MPDGNGEYILRRLKENAATRDIPVVVVTGSRDRMLERKMYNLGAAGYFTKPISWDDFWGKLQHHLGLGPEAGLDRTPRKLTASLLHETGPHPVDSAR
jgi:CheY-like chemotaxis protein